MRYTDRSRTETDHTCPRARLHGYEYEGRGLAPLEQPEPLRFGGAIADQLREIKHGRPFKLDAFLGGDEKLLAEALLVGYELVVWPKWLREYELISIEQEYPKHLSEWLIHNAKPDTLMRKKIDGTIWYGPEDKTTKWIPSLNGYSSNVQLHSTALCVEDHIGERVTGCMVQGLYKGMTRDEKFHHPLVYAYCKEGIPGVMPDQWGSKWVRGWERRATTDFPGGIRGWITYLLKKDPKVVEGVFPNSPPVMLRRDLAAIHLAQVLLREEEIKTWHDEGRPKEKIIQIFPQHFSQCNEYGKSAKPCEFKDLCWNATVQRFPLASYRWREPHHENERLAYESASSE